MSGMSCYHHERVAPTAVTSPAFSVARGVDDTPTDVFRIHSNGGVGGRDGDKGFYDAGRAQTLLQQGYRMYKVNVWASEGYVNGIQTVYSRQEGVEEEEEEVALDEHLGDDNHPPPRLHTLELQEDERLVGVSGTADILVESLVLTTSTGRRLEVGGNPRGGRGAFDLKPKEEEEGGGDPPYVMAFYGGFGGVLYNIGAVFVTPMATSPSNFGGLCIQHCPPPPVNDLLVKAAKKGNKADAEALLRAGADVNHKSFECGLYGGVALCRAAERGHLEVVRLLLDRGASLDARDDKYGLTALMAAAGRGHLEVVTLLLDRGASLDAIDMVCSTALHRAVGSGNTKVVTLLLDRGASVDAKDETGRSVLSLSLCAVEGAEARLSWNNIGEGDWARERRLKEKDSSRTTCIMVQRAMASRGGFKVLNDPTTAKYEHMMKSLIFKGGRHQGIRGAMATTRYGIQLLFP